MDLVAVARLARLGDFQAAEKRLAAMESRVAEAKRLGKFSDPLWDYRILSFRRELLQVRSWPIGGGFFAG